MHVLRKVLAEHLLPMPRAEADDVDEERIEPGDRYNDDAVREFRQELNVVLERRCRSAGVLDERRHSVLNCPECTCRDGRFKSFIASPFDRRPNALPLQPPAALDAHSNHPRLAAVRRLQRLGGDCQPSRLTPHE
jgi:hypothetical protein